MTKRFFSQIRSETSSNRELNNSNTAQNEIDDRTSDKQNLSYFPQETIKSKGERTTKLLARPRVEQIGRDLKTKSIAIAIAAGMLPVLAVGTATYFLGAKAITETNFSGLASERLEEAQLLQQKQLQLLAILLLGTGATALISGAFVAFWVNRSIRKAADNAVTTARQAGLERAERTKLFTDAVYQIRASLKEADILKAAVDETRKVMAADRVIVYSLDENSEGIVIAESVAPRWPRALRAKIDDPCFAARYTEKYQNGRIHAIDDIYEEKLTPCYIEQLESFAVRANLVAPLLNEKKLIGLLIAHQCSQPRLWQQSEIDLFAQIATQVGFALDNAKLIGDRQNLEQQLENETHWKELFADATRHIHASLSEEDVLKAAVEQARQVLAADRVLVYSVDRKSQGVVIAESVAYGWPRALGVTINDPCFEARYIKKYEDGRVRALHNIYEAGMTQCYIDQLETLAVKANLVAPVLHEGKLLGLLVAHQCSQSRVWQPVEIKWFTQIATQVGFALDNVKLIRRVEQMTQEATAQANERHQEKALLRQQITDLLKHSEAAFTTLCRDAVHQAEVISEAIATLQAIADSARSLAASTQKAELQLQQTNQSLQAGYETVNRTIDSIAAFQETVAAANVKIAHLGENAHKLSQFVSLSDDLASQMNRHVINATIESGRNGDFQHSVVFIAEAVRALTQQLAKATTDIEPLVAEFETEAEDLASSMETGTDQLLGGMQLTKETRQKLNQLTTMSANISTLVSNIALSAADQAEKSTSMSQQVLQVASLAERTSSQSSIVLESFIKLKQICQEI